MEVTSRGRRPPRRSASGCAGGALATLCSEGSWIGRNRTAGAGTGGGIGCARSRSYQWRRRLKPSESVRRREPIRRTSGCRKWCRFLRPTTMGRAGVRAVQDGVHAAPPPPGPKYAMPGEVKRVPGCLDGEASFADRPKEVPGAQKDQDGYPYFESPRTMYRMWRSLQPAAW